MNIKDAARLLNITGSVSPQEIKKAYRKAAHQYHPDRNPAGADMMKLINNAYDVLKDYHGTIPDYETQGIEYPEALNTALNAIFTCAGLNIEICGAWVWVSGNTKQHKQILKEVGFKYASKKKRWYFRPDDWQSRSRGSLSMEEIRGKYGSEKPQAPKGAYLQSSRK